MAMSTQIHTYRYDEKKWELLQKKAKMVGTTATQLITDALDKFISENIEEALDERSLQIVDDMYHRKGFVSNALLSTLAGGKKGYDDLVKYCKENNYPIQLYDTDDTVPVESTTTGWL